MTHATHITEVGTVIVPVSDQDQALACYVERLGCEKRLDADSPAGRWIEVALPGAATTIALVATQPDNARREPHDYQLRCRSCRAEGAELTSRTRSCA